MENWTKIYSFDNIYQAELRKEILKNAEINAIVVNAKDSLFLIGSIDLYVPEEDEKKAVYIIEQFSGLTKINSFILKEPVVKFQEYLKTKGIETILKERNSEKYILENFELYINNEFLENVIPYVTGEKIEGWKIVKKCNRVRQARYRIELLESYYIDTFIIKKRDSNYHVEEINIYVEDKNFDKATEILTKLNDWTVIKTYDNFETVELKEDLLGKNGIRGLIEKNQEGKFELFVLNSDKNNAIEILENAQEWIQLQIYETFVAAESIVLQLEQNNIQASIVTLSDNVFIIGGFAVYVEKSKINEAIEIINSLRSGKIQE